jgi:hypothetical protein
VVLKEELTTEDAEIAEEEGKFCGLRADCGEGSENPHPRNTRRLLPGDTCWGMGGVEFKPRDLGDDRGCRVVVVVWAGLNLNPHPPRTRRVRHPTASQDAGIVRTWGAACCAPTLAWWYGLFLGVEGATTGGRLSELVPEL